MDNHIEKYAEHNAKELKQIADEFAIGFGEWLMKKGRYNITNWSKTTKELLEIYKKEKGL